MSVYNAILTTVRLAIPVLDGWEAERGRTMSRDEAVYQVTQSVKDVAESKGLTWNDGATVRTTELVYRAMDELGYKKR